MKYSGFIKTLSKYFNNSHAKKINILNPLLLPKKKGVFMKPFITSHNPKYLSAISIKGNDEPFEILGSVRNYTSGEVHTDINSVLGDKQIEDFLDKDTYMIPATIDRENYHGDRHFDWWLSGLRDYLIIGNILNKLGNPLIDGDSVYEIGCASGRLLRHFAIQQPNLECWGSDIKLRHIEWIRLFLPPHIKIFHNTILPYLPIEDNSINLVCAFSVFTHIDDLEFAWLAEIRRILKKNGILYLTIHSENTWQLMKPGIPIYDSLLQMRKYIPDYEVNEEFLSKPMPQKKTVFYWNTAENYNCNVFHHTSYVQSEWGRFFKIKEIIRFGSGYQDVILLQK